MESSTDVTRRTKTNLSFLFLFVISSSNETMTEAMNKSVVFVSVRIKCAEQRSLQSPRRSIGDFYSFSSRLRHSNRVEPRLSEAECKKPSHLFVRHGKTFDFRTKFFRQPSRFFSTLSKWWAIDECCATMRQYQLRLINRWVCLCICRNDRIVFDENVINTE